MASTSAAPPLTGTSVNMRDVAATIRGVRPGVLVRASVCFTPDASVRTIIDLRRKGAQREPSHTGDAERVLIPFVGHTGGIKLLMLLPISTLARFALSAGSETVIGEYFFSSPERMVLMYYTIAENAQKELTIIANILAKPDAKGVLVHCVAGKDRTGIVVALFTRLVGASIDDIAADYAQSQGWIAQARKQNLLSTVDPLLLDSMLTQSPWEVIVAFLRTVEVRHGSVRNFFVRHVKLSESTVDAVVRNLKASEE